MSLVLNTKGKVYTINNFPSSYVSFVHPDAKVIFHGGEIDPAIDSLTRKGVERVVAVEIDQTAAAVGLWKKEAIRQFDRLDYAALLSLIMNVEPFLLDYPIPHPTFEPVAKRCEQLKKDAPVLNSRIMQNLPPFAKLCLQEFFERRQPPKEDNGTMANLHYLEPSLYDAVRANLDRLEIIVGNIYETASRFPEADVVSVNNTLDYVEGDLSGKLSRVASVLKNGARIVLASTKAGEFTNERIHLKQYEDSSVELFDFEDPKIGKAVLLSEYLKSLGMTLTSEPVVSSFGVRARAFEFPVSPAVASYRNVFTMEMPESGLSQIAAAANKDELREVYMGIAGGVCRNQNMANYSWETYWESVERDANSLGISPFEKSDIVFLLGTKATPASLIFSWFDDGRIAVPRKAAVEIYKKA